MPKSTFLNLRDTKRIRFMETALEEFALNTYESASIGKIIKKLRISKGSVYQYFEHKKDLYAYLITYANQEKQRFIQKNTITPYKDFWDMFGQMYSAGLEFDLANPTIASFLQNVTLEKHHKDLGNLYQVSKKQTSEFFIKLITEAQAKGEFRKGFDISTVSFFVMTLGTSLLDYFLWKYDLNLQEAIKSQTRFFIEKAQIREDVEAWTALMRKGLE